MKKNDDKIQVIIISGKNDFERATLGFATAATASATGTKVYIFLAMKGSYWAVEDNWYDQTIPGFENIGDYINIVLQNEGEIEVCSTCLRNLCIVENEMENIAAQIKVSGLTVMTTRMQNFQTLTF